MLPNNSANNNASDNTNTDNIDLNYARELCKELSDLFEARVPLMTKKRMSNTAIAIGYGIATLATIPAAVITVGFSLALAPINAGLATYYGRKAIRPELEQKSETYDWLYVNIFLNKEEAESFRSYKTMFNQEFKDLQTLVRIGKEKITDSEAEIELNKMISQKPDFLKKCRNGLNNFKTRINSLTETNPLHTAEQQPTITPEATINTQEETTNLHHIIKHEEKHEKQEDTLKPITTSPNAAPKTADTTPLAGHTAGEILKL